MPAAKWFDDVRVMKTLGNLPLPVTGLTAERINYTEKVLLTWNAPDVQQGVPQPHRYAIYRGETVESAALVDTVPASQTEWLDNAAANDKTFYYYLITLDANDIASGPSMEAVVELMGSISGTVYAVIQGETVYLEGIRSK